MSFHIDDTIVAIASAKGGSLRGVVRVSGTQLLDCLQKCFCSNIQSPLHTHAHPSVVPGVIALEKPVGELPCDLYLWPTRRSYTQQPCAEIHTIGSPPLLEAVVRALCNAGARLADPGEFTMRAFLAGRLDLTQAEAVLGVIDSDSRTDLDVALSQLAGGLRQPLDRIRNELLDVLSHLEAGLDFVEEDIEFISSSELTQQLSDTITKIQQLVDQMSQRGASDGEFRIVLVGSPNVGKSSLLNALAGEVKAIVSEVAGTTRDYVAQVVEIGGLKCRLIDTAGLLQNNDLSGIELASKIKSLEQHEQAHLQLFCIDSTRPLDRIERVHLGDQSTVNRLIVLTKIDQKCATDFAGKAIETSSKTGQGLDILRQGIADAFDRTRGSDAEVVSGTAMRCRESLRLSFECLSRAKEAAENELGEELVAAEVRAALDELGKVVGAVYTDDILDRVFSRFCIGK